MNLLSKPKYSASILSYKILASSAALSYIFSSNADIAYTNGAHNIVPYDLDNDGKVELIANSYRSDALSQTCPRNELCYDRFNFQKSRRLVI